MLAAEALRRHVPARDTSVSRQRETAQRRDGHALPSAVHLVVVLGLPIAVILLAVLHPEVGDAHAPALTLVHHQHIPRLHVEVLDAAGVQVGEPIRHLGGDLHHERRAQLAFLLAAGLGIDQAAEVAVAALEQQHVARLLRAVELAVGEAERRDAADTALYLM